MDFQAFPKIPRLMRDVVITEKLDGTNASITIQAHANNVRKENWGKVIAWRHYDGLVLSMWAGSRNRFITPDKDNFGFASWVSDNQEDLWDLGVGTHYGEWWGQGIQRGYGLDHKRLSLFNVGRWQDCHQDSPSGKGLADGMDLAPECCRVVPVLYEGPLVVQVPYYMLASDVAVKMLADHGSHAAPGFAHPEGVMVFHKASQQMFKYTLDGDGHKG